MWKLLIASYHFKDRLPTANRLTIAKQLRLEVTEQNTVGCTNVELKGGGPGRNFPGKQEESIFFGLDL